VPLLSLVFEFLAFVGERRLSVRSLRGDENVSGFEEVAGWREMDQEEEMVAWSVRASIGKIPSHESAGLLDTRVGLQDAGVVEIVSRSGLATTGVRNRKRAMVTVWY